jgi:hypothetical protein
LKPNIGIILGTPRATRFSESAAQWLNIAKQRDDAEFEVVDLRDCPMPFFEEERSRMFAPAKSAIALRWGKNPPMLNDLVWWANVLKAGRQRAMQPIAVEPDISNSSPTNEMVCASAFRRSFPSS